MKSEVQVIGLNPNNPFLMRSGDIIVCRIKSLDSVFENGEATNE